MEERTYPIYSFSAKWSQDGVQDSNYPKHYEGLSEGRIWNGTQFYKMFKEEQTQEQLDEYVKNWWEEFIKNRKEENRPILNPILKHLTSKYVCHETWVLNWFQHATFDTGQSNEEVLESFNKYVDRIQENNERIECQYPEELWHEKGHLCLMGAEDRWRWHGAEPNGGPNDHSPAPCRCKHCKEQGVIRIAH
jgi:hypothetical protein